MARPRPRGAPTPPADVSVLRPSTGGCGSGAPTATATTAAERRTLVGVSSLPFATGLKRRREGNADEK